MRTIRRVVVLLIAAAALAACSSGASNTASSSTTSTAAGSTSTSASTTTMPTYEAVTSQSEYYGVYSPTGGPKAARSYLWWERRGASATGTLKVGSVSALRRMGLATATYTVKLTFAGQNLTMSISGHGVSQVTHGMLNLTG